MNKRKEELRSIGEEPNTHKEFSRPVAVVSEDELDSDLNSISSEDSEDGAAEDQEEDEFDELDEKMEELNVFLPGGDIAQDEELVADQSTYEMLHSLKVEWPCLSFDILKDKLGNGRTTFPMTSYIVAGSQADSYSDNKVYVMKMSCLQKTKNDDGSDDDDDDLNDQDDNAILEYKIIPHEGSVNRIRVMPHPEVHIAATMAETGKVHIFDISQHMNAFDTPGLIPSSNLKPVHTVISHGGDEGFGIDWSAMQPGYLLTGDCRGKIYLTKKTESAFVTDKSHFNGHTSSIEDIQWSPSQGSIFASCSADKTIRIWDLRTKAQAQLTVVAHDCDVNVISWNTKVDYLLASGSDSGQFSIWDLRSWPSSKSKTPETAASFSWHRKAISSIEWHPEETSVLAVSGLDDQLTIWDLALERDEDEVAMKTTNSDGTQIEVPSQLLFIHQGQRDIKELHWHPQAPGVLISTASDGLNVFKTFNS